VQKTTDRFLEQFDPVLRSKPDRDFSDWFLIVITIARENGIRINQVLIFPFPSNHERYLLSKPWFGEVHRDPDNERK